MNVKLNRFACSSAAFNVRQKKFNARVRRCRPLNRAVNAINAGINAILVTSRAASNGIAVRVINGILGIAVVHETHAIFSGHSLRKAASHRLLLPLLLLNTRSKLNLPLRHR